MAALFDEKVDHQSISPLTIQTPSLRQSFGDLASAWTCHLPNPSFFGTGSRNQTISMFTHDFDSLIQRAAAACLAVTLTIRFLVSRNRRTGCPW